MTKQRERDIYECLDKESVSHAAISQAGGGVDIHVY